MHNASLSPRRKRRSRSAVALIVIAATTIALGASALALAKTKHSRAGASTAVSLTSQPFGTVGTTPVRLYTLSNGHMNVNITNFGGIVQSIDVPDSHGQMSDVTLGFKNLAGYEANDAPNQPAGGSGTTYFGATIGRYANRIANGKFTLDGHTYTLPINNGPNTLHGGTNAWNQQVWTPTERVGHDSVSLILTLTSPDGQDGFPGTVVATVTFTLGHENALQIQYHATTTKPTVINMTNHSYFNLAGEGSGSVLGQRLMINANSYTPTDATQIPTRAIDPVAGTPMDFRQMKPIGQDITQDFSQLLIAHGYDHNWVLNGSGMRLAARAIDPVTGRELTVDTTEPGVQLYTGNFLVGDLVGTSGKIYRQGAGFTLETQHYPNSPNQPNFPTTTLNPGTPFNSTTVFQFSTVK